MLLEGRSRNINARRQSRSALIFVSARQHMCKSAIIYRLGKVNLPVRKSYFDSNIIARILRHFFTDYFDADVDISTCLHVTSSRRES